MPSIFCSCEEEMDGGKIRYEPGYVWMDIDGELQKIDGASFEIPADSDYITLTVLCQSEPMIEEDIYIVSSNNMEVELLDPPTEKTKPYQHIYYGTLSYDLYRQHVRINATGNSNAECSIKFYVMKEYIAKLRYVSNFTVTKKATKQ
ncbi:MAG: hypothetical protein NC338_06100 [Firmicutes bacterium]|nr:hypothetical protein [Bacillota bacterium]MCM1400565.1 hypothetical protein [Bacteroides sp.]MCM1476469.1 hypothetical protein [Bacteroides sp.]